LGSVQYPGDAMDHWVVESTLPRGLDEEVLSVYPRQCMNTPTPDGCVAVHTYLLSLAARAVPVSS
jgi:hypothetical protein